MTNLTDNQPGFEIRTGHALQLLRGMPDQSIQCCVTSPPYWGLRSYKTEPQVWGGVDACVHEWGDPTRAPYANNLPGPNGRVKNGTCGNQDRPKETGPFCLICGAWRGELGLEPTPELYVAHLVTIFREVRRVLRNDGTLWLNLGDCYATGGGKIGECPGGGAQGARWAGRSGKDCDPKRGQAAEGQPKHIARGAGYRGNHGDDPKWAGQHPGRMKQNGLATNSGAAIGPVTQPNRMPIAGLKAKDLVGIPWMAAFALRADGWYLRMDNIWSKKNCMPESVRDRTTKSHEYCFHLSKSERYYYDSDAIMEPLATAEGENYPARARVTGRGDQEFAEARGNDRGKSGGFPPRKISSRHNFARATKEGEVPGASNKQHRLEREPTFAADARNKRSVWTIGTKPFRGAHFAVMPEELAETCVLAGCPRGGTVVDPFAGAGTVGVVALRHGRQFLGLELNPKYARMAQRRIFRTAPLTLDQPAGIDEPLDGLPLFA